MARDAIVDKLHRELLLPIETERQVVYVLVQMRKLMDKDKLPGFETLRFFCNWVVHTDLTNNAAKDTLLFLNNIVKPVITGIPAGNRDIEGASRIMGFEKAREDILQLVRHLKLNRELRHMFTPQWWVSFLRQYIHVIQDCPLILDRKQLAIDHLKSATVVGYETSDGDALDDRIESILTIKWTFAFVGGYEQNITIPLAVEKDDGFTFGRDGPKKWQSAQRLKPPKA